MMAPSCYRYAVLRGHVYKPASPGSRGGGRARRRRVSHYERLQALPDHSLEGHMPRLGCITSRVEEEAVLSYSFLRTMCE